jgi:hypothetical protein
LKPKVKKAIVAVHFIMDKKMKSYFSAAILLIFSATAHAQYTLSPTSTDFVLSYENIKRNDSNSNSIPNLGLFGANINFDLYKGFYAGPSIYGAMQGDLGGLFVMGGNAGYRYNLYDDVWVDTGYFAGGGGAHNDTTSDPSGFMSRSHIGLSYNFTYVELGIEYSYVNFPDYEINSHQLAFTFSIPGNILTGDPSYQGSSSTSLDGIFSTQGVNFYRTFVDMYQESYYLNHSTDTNGNELNDTMQLMGAKGGVFFTPNIYFGVSTAGAYDSSKNGYMDFFTLLGFQQYFTQRLFYTIEANIGAGGGGNTDTGSGLMYKSSVGFGYSFTPAFSLLLEGGYITAPSGNFEGPLTSLDINYQFFNAGPESFTSDIGNGQYSFAGWSISGQTETYINPQRSSSYHEIENIDMAVIEMSRQINDTWLVKGQAAGAYGGNAGSYATGMIGPAVQSPLWHRFRLIGDVLVGAAGGGAMDVGRGAIYQPEAGISYDISPYVSLVAKTGRIRSVDGGLDATTYNVGIVFNFTTLQEGL